MKIAICSSKLEHVTRGVETWTKDTAQVLYEKGLDVTLYKGSGAIRFPYEKTLRSVKENTRLSRKLMRLLPPFLWRIGLGKADQLEETTFAFSVYIEAIKHRFDIIHTQDAHVANFLNFLSRCCLLSSKVILGHGTEEPFEFLKRFRYVQHLAPFHLEEATRACGKKDGWFAIPNFVDIEKFTPTPQRSIRDELKIPANAFVILSVAAIKSTHKRLDYLIREVASLNHKGLNSIYLLIAGSRTNETDKILQLGNQTLGSNIRFLVNRPHEELPAIYNTADVFALCSLKEMMPIALLEALSSGLPCLGHKYPVIEWMIGEGGETLDMQEGQLAKVLNKYMDPDYRKFISVQARAQAVRNFSKDVVAGEIIRMYENIIEKG